MRYNIIAILLAGNMTAVAQNSEWIQAVDEYVPAPGQFVNTLPAWEEGDDAASMVRKASEAIANNAGSMITLGAWGGYVTFHFDHPVVNVPGERDLYISGNANTGGSEAGIVMVSQDENGNGLPDDTWYELSGSADTDSTNVIYDYTLTYTKTGNLQDIPWSDNQGGTGTVNRNAFHQQEYYPLWLDTTLTLTGTLLPSNCHDTSGDGSYWILDSFRYGYVDNLPNSDNIGCSFDLSWAVDPFTRENKSLNYADFIRVYTALNQTAGWLGETSTEVSGAKDLHPDATAGIIEIRNDDKIKQKEAIFYDILGRRITTYNRRNTIIIKNQNKN